MKSASLFTGFGGADVGVQMAGYEITWGIEYDDVIAQVARDNGLPVTTADVLNCDPADFERVDHLHASPPCPNFSVAKAGATETEHDIALADKVAEFITILRPRTVTIENVPAYRKSQSYQRILKAITDAGYMYDATIVNAADFSVPQTRRRLIVRAVLGGMIPPLPKPTRWIGWYEAIEDLIPTLPESHFADWQLARLDEAAKKQMAIGESVFVGGANKSQSFLDFAVENRPTIPGIRNGEEPMSTVPADGATINAGRAFLMPNANSSSGVNRNGDEPSPTVGNVNRVGNQPRAFIVDGKPKDYAGELQITDGDTPTVTVTSSQTRHPFRAFLVESKNSNQQYGDGLRGQSEPATTVTTDYRPSHTPKGWLSVGRVVKMTPRALARFQSFPDWYKLPDKASLACRGIGNACPPLMMCAILKGLAS